MDIEKGNGWLPSGCSRTREKTRRLPVPGESGYGFRCQIACPNRLDKERHNSQPSGRLTKIRFKSCKVMASCNGESPTQSPVSLKRRARVQVVQKPAILPTLLVFVSIRMSDIAVVLSTCLSCHEGGQQVSCRAGGIPRSASTWRRMRCTFIFAFALDLLGRWPTRARYNRTTAHKCELRVA
jgi:hypothetical protein